MERKQHKLMHPEISLPSVLPFSTDPVMGAPESLAHAGSVLSRDKQGQVEEYRECALA